MRDKIQKNLSEAVRKRKETVIKKIHEIGLLPGIDVAFIFHQNGRYTTYRSIDRIGWPPSIIDIVS